MLMFKYNQTYWAGIKTIEKRIRHSIGTFLSSLGFLLKSWENEGYINLEGEKKRGVVGRRREGSLRHYIFFFNYFF